MKIYTLEQDVNHYQSFAYCSDDDEDKARKARKSILLADWQPLRIRRDLAIKSPTCGDYPSLLGVPMVSERAKIALEKSSAAPHLQFLDLECTDTPKPLYIMNVLSCIDALDQKCTQFEYFEKDRIGVEIYWFRQDISYPPLFRCYLDKDTRIPLEVFATDELKTIVEAHGLEGFMFKELWDSEATASRSLSWTITKRKDNSFLVTTLIQVNGIGPYPEKKCVLDTVQIRWLCTEVRKLKKESLDPDDQNMISFETSSCRFVVSVLFNKDTAMVILNPMWKDTKKNYMDNVQLPLECIRPFIDDLERQLADCE